jgi:hypothetical protein
VLKYSCVHLAVNPFLAAPCFQFRITCQLINGSAVCLYYFCLVIVKCHFCATQVLFNNLVPKSYFLWPWLIVFSFLVFGFDLVLTIVAFMCFFSFVVCMVLLYIKRY